MIRPVYDKVKVTRWILNSDDPEKENHIRGIMNDKMFCHSFIHDKVPYGFIIWHKYQMDCAFVDYISINKKLNSFKKEILQFTKDLGVNRIRMMTTRPKPWGRIWGGFKPIGTIMEKEI
jgi:hypothetical protein